MKNSNLAAKSSNPEKFQRVIELLQEHLRNMSRDSKKSLGQIGVPDRITTPSQGFLGGPNWTNRTSTWCWESEDRFYATALGSGRGYEYPVWAYLGFSPNSIDMENQTYIYLSDEVETKNTGNNFLFFIYQETDHHFTDRHISLSMDLSSDKSPEDFVNQIIQVYLNPRVNKRALIEKQIEDLQKELKNME
jgi:hypothetical protein